MTVLIERRYCPYCHRYIRDIPNYLYRFKHYDRRIIDDVRTGIITSDSYGYEDYPCEMTMMRWKNRKKSCSYYEEKAN